jgi:hypothetical protein
LFYRQLEQGIVSAYEDAGATMAYNMMDVSALEGVQAFIEKRMQNWVAGAGVNEFARAALADAPWRRHHGHARLVDPAPTGPRHSPMLIDWDEVDMPPSDGED